MRKKQPRNRLQIRHTIWQMTKRWIRHHW